MKPSRKGVGSKVLAFLDAHRLDHSPSNYAFAHRFLFEDDAVLRRGVERITEGGVRISPQEVAELAGVGNGITATGQDNAADLDRLTLRVLDIIGGAALVTGDFNRELVGAAASLVRPDGIDVRAIITAMIERTARAEASLADTANRAQALREELNALRNDASHDRLTGLLNGHGMADLLARAVASPMGCAIAVIDIDRFKSINDAHGHAVGDRVLRAVAAELVAACHPHVVSRWGGGSFLVLLDRTTAAQAGKIVSAAAAGLSLRHLKVRESDASIGAVSVSAGVAASRGRTVSELVTEADALLRRAKTSGCNSVEVEAPLVGISSPGQ